MCIQWASKGRDIIRAQMQTALLGGRVDAAGHIAVVLAGATARGISGARDGPTLVQALLIHGTLLLLLLDLLLGQRRRCCHQQR